MNRKNEVASPPTPGLRRRERRDFCPLGLITLGILDKGDFGPYDHNHRLIRNSSFVFRYFSSLRVGQHHSACFASQLPFQSVYPVFRDFIPSVTPSFQNNRCLPLFRPVASCNSHNFLALISSDVVVYVRTDLGIDFQQALRHMQWTDTSLRG